ncbi:MAG: aminotransferase class I/II-fold pyridoxal phosphate-dependent enzyme [Clostridia bacterium]|nr:aminotransferase class I/II-fold pyridoxal phosphate-dependent enzyme [Clostridia bacterium]
MQAVILAAGMGKRLKHLTQDATKCMIKVNGVTLIERMLSQLDSLKLEKIVVVVGYQSQKLIDYISTLSISTPIEYVDNPIYDSTNNIYSLFLAREHLLNDDTLLLESDLIFEDAALEALINDPYPSLALVAKFESWMDGTVVTLDSEKNIVRFIGTSGFKYDDIKSYYKTVNIYKFSRDFSRTHYVPFLEAYCRALGNNEYYEQVLKVIVNLEKPDIKARVLDKNISWYEIDDVQDLDIAESIFAPTVSQKLSLLQKRYGGYWRYEKLIDFCYLVNPFYPSQKLLDEIKANFETLVCEYPSGMAVNSLLAAKYFDISPDMILVGNGAAELIKSLMSKFDGKIGITLPTFEEYPQRRSADGTVCFTPSNSNYSYTADDLMEYFADKDISSLLVINPDNPSGNFIPKHDMLRLASWALEKGIKLVVDESFIDFAKTENDEFILINDLLISYPNLIVIKSISKSFGVPGFRLGILASADKELIADLKKDVAIWNINSFGEFFMQIFEKYKKDYTAAMSRFKEVRDDYVSELSKIKHLRIIPSQANYIMCEITKDGMTARRLTEELLDEQHILIKDLSTKKGISGEYIRIAVKRSEENQKLVDALKEKLS